MITSRSTLVGLLIAVAVCAARSAAMADAVTVQGTVLLPTGEPAAGARVLLGYYATTGYLLAETKTDAAGKFALNADNARAEAPLQVIALQPGCAAAWEAARPGGEVALRLGARPAALAGTVTDPEGKPAAGVEILLYGMGYSGARGMSWFYFAGSSAPTSPLKATTGPDGRFSIADLPAGASVTYGVRAAGWAPMTDQTTIGQGELGLVLAREARVSGRVLAEGKPVAGVTVVGSGRYASAQSAPTGADGTYTLAHLGPGALTLRVANPPAELASAMRTDVTLKPGDDLAGIDLALTQGALLSGKVTEAASGKPVAAVSVSVSPQGPGTGATGAYYQAQTGADGTWELRAPAGRYAVRVWRRPSEGVAEWVPEPQARELEVVEGGAYGGLDFTLAPPPTLKGRVLRPDGSPAAGAEVLPAMYGYYSGASAEAVKTDAEGRFALPVSVGRGRYYRGGRGAMAVVARDLAAGQVGLTFVGGPDEQADIRLAPGGYVLIKATDARAQPVPGAGVMVWLLTAEGRPTAALPGGDTDARGQLRLGPLPTGLALSVRVNWQQQSYTLDTAWDNPAPVTLAEGEQKELPPLRIDLQGREVSGRVTDGEGRAVARALVSAGLQQVAYSDAQGNYALGGLPLKGSVWLLAMDGVKPLFAAREVAADEAQGVNLQLQPVGALAGTIVDAEGKPIAGAEIRLSSNSQSLAAANAEAMRRLQEAGYSLAPPTTDAQGKWQARGLVAGLYRLYVSVPNKPDQLAENQEVRVQGGETTDLGKLTVKPPVPGAPPGGPLPPPPPPPGAGGPAPKD